MAYTTIRAPYCSADISVDCATFRSSYGTANGGTARSWVHSFLTSFDDYANVLHAVDSCTVLLGGWQGGSLITPTVMNLARQAPKHRGRGRCHPCRPVAGPHHGCRSYGHPPRLGASPDHIALAAILPYRWPV